MNNDKLKADLKHIQGMLFLIIGHINDEDIYDLKKGYMLGRDIFSTMRFIEKMIETIDKEKEDE